MKALATISAGWLAYWLVIKRVSIKLPRGAERLEHLIGMMSLSAIALSFLMLYLMPQEGLAP